LVGSRSIRSRAIGSLPNIERPKITAEQPAYVVQVLLRQRQIKA
jgi:hypothetical protein